MRCTTLWHVLDTNRPHDKKSSSSEEMVVCVRHTRLTDQHFLCQAVVSEFQKGFSPPGMRSRGDIPFARFFVCRSIEDGGSFCPFRYRIQFINPVVCAEEETAMKCLDDKSFCTFEITDLQPSGIHQLIVTVPETDTVPGINGALCQDSQCLALEYNFHWQK